MRQNVTFTASKMSFQRLLLLTFSRKEYMWVHDAQFIKVYVSDVVVTCEHVSLLLSPSVSLGARGDSW